METITQIHVSDQPEVSIVSLTEQVCCALQENYDLSVPEECTPFVVRCLRVKDYDVNKTAKLVKNVARSMEALRDMLDKFQPKLYKNLYFNGTFTVLRARDDKGRQVLVNRMGKWDPKAFDFDEACTASMLLFGYIIAKSVETQRNGVVFIYDLTGFGLRHVKAVKPARLIQLVRMMQDGAPGKIKGIHLIFHPRAFGAIYQLVKPLLKEKITKRVHFHGDDLSSLHQFLSPEILTTSLGGLRTESEGMDIALLERLICEDTIHKGALPYLKNVLNVRCASNNEMKSVLNVLYSRY